MNPPAVVNRDEEHLKLLSTFHYVVAAIGALFSLFPIFHVIFGLAIILVPNAFGGSAEGPPPFVGWIFLTIGAVIILCGLTLSACIFAAGRFIAQRRNYTFCLVIAGLECLMMPFGTVLGVFTIVVLMRDTVKPLFGYSS